MIEAELNHLYWRQWDWVVTPTAGNVFTVIFPDAISYGYATRSGQITLALHQLVVDITEPILDPKAVVVLDTAWILVGGLLDIARSEVVIRQMSRILGKVVVVDELSLGKEEEDRVKVKCMDSSKLRATIRVFFNDRSLPTTWDALASPMMGPPVATPGPMETTTAATTPGLTAPPAPTMMGDPMTRTPALRLRRLHPPARLDPPLPAPCARTQPLAHV